MGGEGHDMVSPGDLRRCVSSLRMAATVSKLSISGISISMKIASKLCPLRTCNAAAPSQHKVTRWPSFCSMAWARLLIREVILDHEEIEHLARSRPGAATGLESSAEGWLTTFRMAVATKCGALPLPGSPP